MFKQLLSKLFGKANKGYQLKDVKQIVSVDNNHHHQRKDEKNQLKDAKQMLIVDILLSDMTDIDAKKRHKAVWLLGGGFSKDKIDLNDPRIIDALILAINDNDQEVKDVSVWSLSKHLSRKSDQRIINTLYSLLVDKSNSDRIYEEALNGLKEHSNSDIVKAAISFLDHQNEKIRDRAAYLLGTSKDLTAVEPLISALKNNIQSSFIIALGKIGDQRAVVILIDILQSTSNKTLFDHDTPGRIADALGKIGDSRAIDPLIEALSGAKKAAVGVAHYSSPRIDYIIALKKLNATTAINTIKNYIKDENQEVSDAAMESIEYLQTTDNNDDGNIQELIKKRKTFKDKCDELNNISINGDPNKLIQIIKEKVELSKGIVDSINGIPYIYDDIKTLERIGVPAVIPVLSSFGDNSMIQRWNVIDLKERTAPYLISETICSWIKSNL